MNTILIKRISISGIMFLTMLLSYTLNAQQQFQKVYGEALEDVGQTVKQTTDGGYIISGFTKNFRSPATDRDLFVMKTDVNGAVQWMKTYGGSGQENGHSSTIIQTSDGGYALLGFTESFPTGTRNIYLLKLFNNGNLDWQRTYTGSGSDHGRCIRQTADGGYIITGTASTAPSSGLPGGVSDLYVLKIDNIGNKQFERTFGQNNEDHGTGIVELPAPIGGYIVVGVSRPTAGQNRGYAIRLNANFSVVWENFYTHSTMNVDGFRSINPTSDGQFIIAGFTSSASTSNDIWLAKMKLNGNLTWAKSYAGASFDQGFYAEETSDQGFIVSGLTSSFGPNLQNQLLIKTDNIGTVQWSNVYEGTAAFVLKQWGDDVTQTTDGGFIFTSQTDNFGAGGNDIYLVKTDALGISGCNQQPVTLTQTLTPTTITSNTSIATGTIVLTVGTPNTIVDTVSPIDSSLCTSSGCPYAIADIDVSCNDNTFCVWLTATQIVTSGIIGMEYCLDYDANVMTPTGNATLGNVVLQNGALSQPADADVYVNHLTDPGKVHLSIYYTPNAPANTFFTGMGNVVCVEFTLNTGVALGTTGMFSSCELEEAYALTEVPQCVDDGNFTVVNDDDLQGSIIFWDDNNKPLKYDAGNPNQYRVTNILRGNSSCMFQAFFPSKPDLQGDFTVNNMNSSHLIIRRNYPGAWPATPSANNCVNVMAVINGQDCFEAGQITTLNAGFTPNSFQMVAADVNMNDKVRANDITHIQDRIVKNICEFPQAWNYTVDALGNYMPTTPVRQSFDWRFIDNATINTAPDYLADGLFPLANNTDGDLGFWRDNVPEVPACLSVVNLPSCPFQETYHGILLGDVNGSWQSDPPPVILKTNPDDEMIFDLQNAVALGNNTYRIPVYYNFTGTLNAFDFSMEFDADKLTVNGVYAAPEAINAAMRMVWNIPGQSELLLTSYTMKGMETVDAVYYLEVEAREGDIVAADLGMIHGYLNGEPTDVRITFDLQTGGFPQSTKADRTNLSQVFPNPANNFAVVTYNNGNAESDLAELAVFNALGEKILSYPQLPAQGRMQLDVSSLPAGAYYIALMQNDRMVNHTKLVVQH